MSDLNQEHLDAITKAVEKAVPPAIDKAVNGHIKDLSKKVDERFDDLKKWGKEVDTKLENLKPAEDVLTFLNIGKRGIKWASGVLIAVAAVVAIFHDWGKDERTQATPEETQALIESFKAVEAKVTELQSQLNK